MIHSKEEQIQILEIMFDSEFVNSLTNEQITSIYNNTINKLCKLSKLPFFKYPCGA